MSSTKGDNCRKTIEWGWVGVLIPLGAVLVIEGSGGMSRSVCMCVCVCVCACVCVCVKKLDGKKETEAEHQKIMRY